MKTMVVAGMILYVDKSKDGFISISSDGYKEDSEMWKSFMDSLKQRQTEDDLEMQAMMNATRQSRTK